MREHNGPGLLQGRVRVLHKCRPVWNEWNRVVVSVASKALKAIFNNFGRLGIRANSDEDRNLTTAQELVSFSSVSASYGRWQHTAGSAKNRENLFGNRV